MAKSSQDSIESLWKIGADVANLYASMVTIFSSFLDILINTTIDQERAFEGNVKDFNLINSALHFSESVSSGGTPRVVVPPTAIDTKLPNPYFRLNLIVARKLSSSFESRIFKEEPKLASLSNLVVPESRDSMEEAKKLEAEETSQNNRVYYAMELQDDLRSKEAPSLAMIATVVKEIHQQVNAIALTAAKNMPKRVDLTINQNTSSNFPSFLKKKMFKESAPLQTLERSKEAEYPHLAKIDFAPYVLNALIYAEELPTLISKQQTYSTKTARPLSNLLLGYSGVFSPSSSSSSSSPSTIEPSRFPMLTTRRLNQIASPSFVFLSRLSSRVFDAINPARMLSFLFSRSQSSDTGNDLSNVMSEVTPISSLSSSLSSLKPSLPLTTTPLPEATIDNNVTSSPAGGQLEKSIVPNFAFAVNFIPQILEVSSHARALPALVSQQSSLVTTNALLGFANEFSLKPSRANQLARTNYLRFDETNPVPPLVSNEAGTSSEQDVREEKAEYEAIDEEMSRSILAYSHLSSTLGQAASSIASWVTSEADVLSLSGISFPSVSLASLMAKRLFSDPVFQQMLSARTPIMSNGNEVAYPSPGFSAIANGAVSESLKTRRAIINRENSIFEPEGLSARKFTKLGIQSTQPNQSAIALLQETERYRSFIVNAVNIKKAINQHKQALSLAPAAIAFADEGNLIVEGVKHELADFTNEAIAVSTYGEVLAELNINEPARATTLAGAQESFSSSTTGEPPVVRAPLISPSPSRPTLPNATIQDTINLTVSTDSSEDLRDLERKIGRILSEQISRYYGSSGI